MNTTLSRIQGIQVSGICWASGLYWQALPGATEQGIRAVVARLFATPAASTRCLSLPCFSPRSTARTELSSGQQYLPAAAGPGQRIGSREQGTGNRGQGIGNTIRPSKGRLMVLRSAEGARALIFWRTPCRDLGIPHLARPSADGLRNAGCGPPSVAAAAEGGFSYGAEVKDNVHAGKSGARR